MTGSEDRARVAQIVSMATALAEQILAEDTAGQPLDEKHSAAMATAAHFLLEIGIPWPSVIDEAIELLARHQAR